MQKAPIPNDEGKRMEALHELGILDTEPDPRFDSLTEEAAKSFDVKISTISIIDRNREWYKSCYGLDAKEGPRDISFCGHALMANSIFIVEDTLKSEIFKDNPYVVGPPYVRFYAGVVLKESVSGQPVGVFCIKDNRPRRFSALDVSKLMDFGQRAEKILNEK